MYWEITLWNGEVTPVKPSSVDYVNERMGRGEGHILTPSGSIAVKDIKHFRPTEREYIEPSGLLAAPEITEDVARAFQEPMYNDDKSMIVKAVKKKVPVRRYNQYYVSIPSYKLLEMDDQTATIGYKLPVHLINYSRVQDCTAQEEMKVL